MSRFTYRASGLSDIGNVKKQNEDAYLLKAARNDAEQILFSLVADGMGGLPNGDMASLGIKRAFERWFMEELPQALKADCFDEVLAQQWQDIIVSENETLNSQATASGTTLTALLLYGGKFYTANIGDSRIYRLNRGTLYQLTVDHSWAQEAILAGLDADQIENDPRRNTLTRCIGAGLTAEPDTDFTSGNFVSGDAFLLCSDGLRHLISAQEIRDVLASDEMSTDEKTSLLIETAKQRFERDNITAVIICCEEGDVSDSFVPEETDAAEKAVLDRTVKLSYSLH
ncbi:MAG: serine/threonine-protein phosphatase [Anaerolineaceae bacterium]|nr:serine/threonine-protein phosphatase [Anaerolineaceae bacterium]